MISHLGTRQVKETSEPSVEVTTHRRKHSSWFTMWQASNHFGWWNISVKWSNKFVSHSFSIVPHWERCLSLQTGLDVERRYLIANKIDLIEDRKVDEEVGQRVRVTDRTLSSESRLHEISLSSLFATVWHTSRPAVKQVRMCKTSSNRSRRTLSLSIIPNW